jgi:tight adherence protein C
MPIAIGVFMVSLSYKLLNPLSNLSAQEIKPFNNSDNNGTYKSIAGLLSIGTLSFITTTSVETVALTIGIPLMYLVLKVLVNSKYRKKRQAIIGKEFPLLLDYLVFQVESGHSIQQALQSASRLFASSSYLHHELRELNDSISFGLPTLPALEQFRQKLDTDVAAVSTMAIIQAIRHGTPLGKILREQSKRMRDDLVLQGEQFANTVSVRILIPLLIFIFPASFLVIFSPVIVSLSGGLP